MRRLSGAALADGKSFRLAYADPPYPGLAKYYQDQPTYAGEVDHVALVASLMERFDGWALSTSSKALRDVLPLCPKEARVCAWVKPIGASSRTRGLHSTWEPVIVVPARRRRPGMRDWISAKPARLGGSTLIGRKPLAFCAWLFGALGALPGDELEDLFPGSGVVGRAWASFAAAGDASPMESRDVVADGSSDVGGVLERRPAAVAHGSGRRNRRPDLEVPTTSGAPT